MAITATSTVAMVREKFPQAVVETVDFRGEETIILRPEHLVTVCAYLLKNQQYSFLSSVTAVDWLEREPRFDVVYHLLSIPNQSELRLKVRVGQPGEADLRRILMPMDWTTHPLRKDYPLTGFDLPEPHWGGQVPYDIDPGVGSQTMRTPYSRELNESRSKFTQSQEPGTEKK